MSDAGTFNVEFAQGKPVEIGSLAKAVDLGETRLVNFSRILEKGRQGQNDYDAQMKWYEPRLEQHGKDAGLRAQIALELREKAEAGQLSGEQLRQRQQELQKEILARAKEMTGEQFMTALKADFDPVTTPDEKLTPEMSLRKMVMEYEVINAVNQRLVTEPSATIGGELTGVQGKMSEATKRFSEGAKKAKSAQTSNS